MILTQEIRSKAVTIDDYSSLFATFRDCWILFALFAIRYSLFAIPRHPNYRALAGDQVET